MLVIAIKPRAIQNVAVVEMDGPIGQRIKANEYVKLFRHLEDNDHVRAVVLDIDSPGGSATGSGYLYMGVKSLAAKKPVIAFIRGLGASGAYMLAAPTTRIVAIPSALIGSIGVISMRPLVYEALDRLGVRMTVTKSDRLKDMGSMFREPTEEEQKKEQELVDDLYDQFLDAVSEGRGMDKTTVKDIATGEVYTARKCKDLGLVDELGDLERAIDLAAELGNAPRRPVWMKPKRSLREMLSGLAASSFVDAIATRVEERLLSSRYDIQHRL
ncbi:MAG TPA: signal peptide peptidase SppA [Dehalococcoidia bacterium]|jgi:protease-4|nr:signal peptide peptidase SppA [Dehalococcoidia bacterium]